MILIVDTFNYVDNCARNNANTYFTKITSMKPTNPKCVILCPKCAKIYLEASGGQKFFPGVKLRTPNEGRERSKEGRGGSEEGERGQGGRGGRREGLAHPIILT